ncbi:MAG: DUF1501 domain-containing protein [Planctomycetaceae bacterium]|nr:DUF1501 domain-containing protein [Planctomycetaceae bacterium]
MWPQATQTRNPVQRMPRRTWLRLGSLAAMAGLSSARPAGAAEPQAAPGFGRARSVVLVFANGGQSQLDMWDMKPSAPLDVRGAFQPIATSVAGVSFCEHMPRIAAVADRLTVVRSLSHEDLDHGSAAYLALTGCYHARRSSNPPPSPTDNPTYGAVLRRVRPTPRFVADAVHLNGPALIPFEAGPGQNGGFLGRAFEPLVVGDPAGAAGAIPGLAPQLDLPPERMDDRLSLKQTLDRELSRLDALQPAYEMDGLYSQARAMLASPQVRAAFDLSAEPAAIRDSYGRHRSGQSLLLARRLVAAGVPYVNVIWNHSNRGQDESDETDQFGWDTHNDIFTVLRDRLLPRFDQSFSSFIEDLDRRGLLDETLVVCMGEFGRAPRVALEPRFAGATPGRKHWASAYSIVVAGAGVQRGAIVGATDRFGAEPITDRYGPWDVAATMFHALGIDPHAHYLDSLGRPLAIASGKPIAAIYA